MKWDREGKRQEPQIIRNLDLTRALVVFKAYERTNPTNAASTPVVTSATKDSIETMKMMHVPTNSNLTANQRLIEMPGR